MKTLERGSIAIGFVLLYSVGSGYGLRDNDGRKNLRMCFCVELELLRGIHKENDSVLYEYKYKHADHEIYDIYNTTSQPSRHRMKQRLSIPRPLVRAISTLDPSPLRYANVSMPIEITPSRKVQLDFAASNV